MAFDLGDYVTVPERIAAFYAIHPNGRICSSTPKVVTIADRVFIEVTTSVWRDLEDVIPCVGTAWEPFPGKTPYTKDSEMMNAETSAIGRAIAASGVAVNRSLASREEVAARTSQPAPKVRQAPKPADGEKPAKQADAIHPEIDVLSQRLAELPEHLRLQAKTVFFKKFGKPVDLQPHQFDAANAFVSIWEEKVA